MASQAQQGIFNRQSEWSSATLGLMRSMAMPRWHLAIPSTASITHGGNTPLGYQSPIKFEAQMAELH